MDTAVVFLVFRRPDLTARVFESIRQARPKTLLVVADGPRSDRPDEAGQCAATRAAVERVDWPCEVLRNYSDANLGCKHRVASGLDWAFEQVEEAIILEDDCLPDPTFFRFAEELLERYRDDRRIMTVSGDNFLQGRRTSPHSYYFSRYMHCWGWASWRRAWRLFDLEMRQWPALRQDGWLADLFPVARQARYWESIFDRVHRGEIDTWDYIWTYSIWSQSGLNVLPERNLVSNIGFGGAASHTHDKLSPWANLPTEAMTFPLDHPTCVLRNHRADAYSQQSVFQGDLVGRAVRKVLREIGVRS
jgi:hypothetical protein